MKTRPGTGSPLSCERDTITGTPGPRTPRGGVQSDRVTDMQRGICPQTTACGEVGCPLVSLALPEDGRRPCAMATLRRSCLQGPSTPWPLPAGSGRLAKGPGTSSDHPGWGVWQEKRPGQAVSGGREAPKKGTVVRTHGLPGREIHTPVWGCSCNGHRPAESTQNRPSHITLQPCPTAPSTRGHRTLQHGLAE